MTYSDIVAVSNANTNPECAVDLTGWTGTSLARIASDTDFGTSCAELPSITGTGTITVANLTCLPNQIAFARAAVKKTGAGSPKLSLAFYSSAPALISTQDVDARAGASAGSVVNLEGFAKAPASTATVKVVISLLSGSSSTLRATKVQIVPNARDDCPLYVTSSSVKAIPPFPINGYNDPALAAATLTPAKHIAELQEFGASWTRGGPNYTAISGAVSDWQAQPIAPYMNALQSAGIRLCFIAGIPAYINGGTDTSLNTLSSGNYSAVAAFNASFVSAWPSVVQAVEFYNEPNTGFFYNVGSGGTTTPDASKYTAVLKVLYPAIKAVQNIPVLGGALSTPNADDSTNKKADTFLTSMYSAGAKGFMDGVSVHPYPVQITSGATSGNVGMYPALEALRAILVSNSDPIPFWMTEAGLPTNTFTQEQQQIGVKLIRGWCQRQPDINGTFLHTYGIAGADDYAFMNLTNGARKQAPSFLVKRPALGVT